MSKSSTPPSRESDIAALRAELAQLKVLTRGLRPHRLRDHTDVIVQGASPGAAMAYGGEAEGGKWRPGSASADLPLLAAVVVNHACSNDTDTTVAFSFATDESDGAMSFVSNKVKLDEVGWYLLVYDVRWSADVDVGQRMIRMEVPSGYVSDISDPWLGSASGLRDGNSLSTIEYVSSPPYTLVNYIQQTSGGSLAAGRCSLTAVKLL